MTAAMGAIACMLCMQASMSTAASIANQSTHYSPNGHPRCDSCRDEDRDLEKHGHKLHVDPRK